MIRRVALCLLLATASLAHAQPRRDPDGPVVAGERREQIKKKIRTMRAFTLTEELALDENTAARLFPVLARFDDETDHLLAARRELQRRLRHADTMRNPNAIERLIDDAIANQRAFWNLEDRKIAELRKILNPVQMSKLLVVLPALERKIQTQLRKAIVQQRAGKRLDTVDEDDDPEPDEARPARREAPLAAPTTAPPRQMPSNAPGNTPPCDPRSQPCPR
ncbi:MAG TPA: hypothetical protein VFP84_04490 [Kofleriaceae bacterium]|nr:hypothetical protein [Kofleriaceae bacterium]